MSFESFTAYAGSTGFGILALAGAGWGWVYWRTGSGHAFSMRLWRVLTGTRDIADSQIRAYVAEQDSLMAFRISSGMRANSTEHARRAIAFIAARELSPDLVRQAGDYFCANELRMASRPSKRLRAWHFFTTGTLLLVFAMTGLASFEKRVLVTLKETGTWLWLSNSDAQPVRPMMPGSRPILSFSQCPGPDITGWSAHDIAIVCSVGSDPALAAYVEKTQKRQRMLFLVLAAISLALGGSQWLDFQRANAASRLAKMLDALMDDAAVSALGETS